MPTEQSGFDAISGTPPTGKIAQRRLVRNPDGTNGVKIVDATTGLELLDTTGYTILEGNNYLNPNSLGGTPPVENNPPLPVLPVSPPTSRFDGKGVDSRGGEVTTGTGGSPSYINKPAGMGLAGMIPGPIGTVGKLANIGINMNNTAAVNDQRKRLGLEEQSLGGKIKSSLFDQKGKIAEVRIGDQQVPVSFEAETKHGRTTMTPKEAEDRARARGVSIEEVSQEEERLREKELGSRKNPFSRMISEATSFIDNLFGKDDEDASGGFMSKDTFPDRPSAPSTSTGSDRSAAAAYDGKSYSGQNKGLDSPSESGGRFGGSGLANSPAAERDIDSGKSGLY